MTNLGLPDAYVLRARVAPVIVAALPLFVLFFTEFFDITAWENIAVTGIIGLTFITLLAQIGRDRGKNLEPKLFNEWGGKPTTTLLRHQDKGIDETTKQRLHKILSSKVPEIQLPNRNKELENPMESDSVYDSAVAWLRSNTSNNQRFPRLHEENISYGFRRNLLGLKPSSLLLAVSLVVVKAIREKPFSLSKLGEFLLHPSVLTALILIAFLIAVVKKDWVKTAAFNYAYALFNAAENLE